MRKQALKAYAGLICEIEVLREEIQAAERYEEFLQTHMGVYSMISDTEARRRQLREKLRMLEEQRMRQVEDVEEFINSVEDSVARTCFRLRYIEARTWAGIAYRLHLRDEQNPRRICDRYLAKYEEERA